MGKKLTDDQIKWILSVDASQAQQEVSKLVTNNKELEKSNVAIRKSMTDLVAAGKKESDAYNKLNSDLKTNNDQLANNKKQIDALEKSMKLEDLTMSQLAKRSKELANQLNNTSKSLHPEQYAKLEKNLTETRKRMDELKGVTQSVSQGAGGGGISNFMSQFSGAAKEGGSTILSMIPVWGRFAGAIGGVAGALAFAKKSMESTRATSKEFKSVIEGLETAWTYLLKSVATGDFTFKGMMEAFTAGKDFKKEMGKINKEKQSLDVAEAKNYVRIQELTEISRDVTKSAKERRDASAEIVKLTQEDADIKAKIAKEEYGAAMKKLTALTGLTQGEYETFMENYNKREFQALEKSAGIYNKVQEAIYNKKDPAKMLSGEMLDKYEADYKRYLEIDRDIVKKSGKKPGQAGFKEYWRSEAQARKQAIDGLFTNEEKVFAKTVKAYGKTTSDEIDNIVQLQVAAIRVPGEAIQESMRARRNMHKLDKELSDDASKAAKEAAKKAQEDAFKDLENANNKQITYLKQKRNDEIADEFNFEELVLAQKITYLEGKLKLEKKYGIDTASTQGEIYDAQLELENFLMSQSEENLKKRVTKVESILSGMIADAEKALAEAGKNITVKDPVKEQLDKLQKHREILAKYNLISLEQQKKEELAIANKALKDSGASQEEALKVQKAIDDKYRDMYLDGWSKKIAAFASVISTISQTITGFQDAETSKIEARYNKQIDAARKAGKETTKIEEQKEAEIAAVKAKYADANFIVQAASITASTAEAAINAYKAMVGIPVVGPILAPIAAGAAVIYGGAQIAEANAAREAAKQGYADGGYTGDGGKYEVAGYASNGRPYHRGEYFVAQEEFKNPQVAPLVARIENIRRQRTASNPLPSSYAGYANGGFAFNQSQNYAGLGIMIDKMKDMFSQTITAEVSLLGQNGLVNQQAKLDKLNKRTKRS